MMELLQDKSIAVLMATRNGMRWLPAQVKSILEQKHVVVALYVSDDWSDDGTHEWLLELARADLRVRVLPRTMRFGSAAKNFFHLICHAPWQHAQYIAFADQDDIWVDGKLLRQIRLLADREAWGVSSNVMAVWADGREKLVVKSQRQRRWDYIFSSAGPGCTYLVRADLLAVVHSLLTDAANAARECALHDWLLYACCRTLGKPWIIEDAALVRYHQHDANEFGANLGLSAAHTRVRNIINGWHRNEVIKLIQALVPLRNSLDHDDLVNFLSCLNGSVPVSRFRLMGYALQGRRSLKDRLILCLAIAAGVW